MKVTCPHCFVKINTDRYDATTRGYEWPTCEYEDIKCPDCRMIFTVEAEYVGWEVLETFDVDTFLESHSVHIPENVCSGMVKMCIQMLAQEGVVHDYYQMKSLEHEAAAEFASDIWESIKKNVELKRKQLELPVDSNGN